MLQMYIQKYKTTEGVNMPVISLAIYFCLMFVCIIDSTTNFHATFMGDFKGEGRGRPLLKMSCEAFWRKVRVYIGIIQAFKTL